MGFISPIKQGESVDTKVQGASNTPVFDHAPQVTEELQNSLQDNKTAVVSQHVLPTTTHMSSITQTSQKKEGEVTLNDAINFIHDRDNVSKIRKVEEFFNSRLKAKQGMLEEECQCTYYLLCAKLKKHSYFESPDCKRIREELLKKTNDFEEVSLESYKASAKGPVEKAQMGAFYKMMEHYYGALEEKYDDLKFHHARDFVFEHKMRYRKHHFRVEGKMRQWFLYTLFELTSLYGLNISRWFVTSMFTILIFAFIYFFIDIFSLERIVDFTVKGHWFDYFYYSIVTFTTLGYGDILPITMLQKIAVSLEVVTGYVMLGLFTNLLGKKI